MANTNTYSDSVDVPALQKSFAMSLNALLEREGLSVQEFADRIEVSGNTIRNYLTQKGTYLPDTYVLAKIAMEFDISIDFLLGMVTLDEVS